MTKNAHTISSSCSKARRMIYRVRAISGMLFGKTWSNGKYVQWTKGFLTLLEFKGDEAERNAREILLISSKQNLLISYPFQGETVGVMLIMVETGWLIVGKSSIKYGFTVKITWGAGKSLFGLDVAHSIKQECKINCSVFHVLFFS